jgi:photosystem II stability/assembly factor-like uncharacterized protein
MTKTHLTLLFTTVLTAVALALPAGAVAAIPAGNTGWNWSNPLPQGNSLINVTGKEGRTWAGGATGTLIHSDDRGHSWKAVRTGLLDDVRTVEAISNQSVVFAGRCALRRSDDGGMTVRRLAWSASDDDCAAEIKDVSFPTAVVGHLLLSNGDLYVSTDGGSSFQRQSVAPNSPAAKGTAAVQDIHFTSPQKGLLAVGGEIYRSIDGGVLWSPVAPPGQFTGVQGFTFIDANVGFATVDGGGLLKTTNAGEAWEQVSPVGLGTVASLACWDELRCIASVAAGGQVARSFDGGQTWGTVPSLTSGVSRLTVSAGGDAVAVDGDGLIALSSDFGATWTRADARAGGAYKGLRASSKRIALVFGEQGALAITRNAGASWAEVATGTGKELVDALAVGKSVLALERGGRLLRIDPGAASGLPVGTALRSKPTGLMAWAGGRTLLAGPRGVTISGKWGKNPARGPGSIRRMRLTTVENAGSAVFVHGPAQIAVTGDRGRTFRRVAKPRGSGSIVRLEMLSAKRGYLLDRRAELFATANGGRSWRRIETTGANSAVTMAFGDARHGYIGDASGRILATSDAGATWLRQYPFFDNSNKSPLSIVGLSRLGALALVRGGNRIFGTSSGGRIGQASTLTIKPSIKYAKRGTVVPVTGQLRPATGVERVSVLARVKSARGGTQWVTQNVTVSASGTFSTKWKITADTVLIARWSGDAAHDGDAAPLKIVRVRR